MMIKITKKCNNNCKICFMSDKYHQKTVKADPFPEEQLKSLISENKNLKSINFSGGEPTVHPKFFQLMEILKENNVELILNSNLRLFCYEEFVKKILQYGNLAFVRTSLYSHIPEIHDSITQTKGSWDQTVGGMKNLLKYGFNPENLKVNMVMTTLNIANLKETAKFILNLDKSINLKFSFLDAEGNVMNNTDLLPKLQTVYPHLLEAVETVERMGIKKVFVEKGPLCSCPNKKIINYLYEPSLLEGGRHMKPKNCNDCNQDRCVGIHKNYFKIYGGDELSPVGKLQIKISS
ncbi:MAG: radical SAM protein [Candidatus Aenigmatarchaeota archaeon]